jgi:two-component system phosphate regulon sensor histidine kinase PhoR
MRADFVANASHELRTPLASLLGFVETLQGPARHDLEAQQRFLSIMGEQARRMSRLIDDLLSLSHIEQTLHVRPDTQVDLTAIAAHMADALAPMAQDSAAEIRVISRGPVYVHGDRDELLRVTENLVENAIKYGGPGEVMVRVRLESDCGVLEVEDYGPGIAAEHIPRLTERFYRIDPGDSRAKGGTGLGLAIVKHIVARHRGRLDVESTPARGSRFMVSLPRAD